MLKKVATILLVCFSVVVYAQPQNLPLSREFNLHNNKVFDHLESSIHTSSQPIILSFTDDKENKSWLSESEEANYLINLRKDERKSRKFFSWLGQSLFHQNFLVVDTNDIYLTVDPLINVGFGNDSENTTLNKDKIYTNTRGATVKGFIGKKFAFQTTVYENQTFAPNYIKDFVNASGVMPGQGRIKTFKTFGYDYAYSDAYVSFSPKSNLNFQLGNGKNFIGDGYRSLLLSDIATNYPFLKANWLFGKGKFLYSKIHGGLANLTRRPTGSVPESLFERKNMSVHYINWLATKWLNIGLFESTIWQTEDSTQTLPFEYRQLNPIPLVNSLTTGFNKSDKSVVGLNTKITLPFKTVVYNQLVYDGNFDGFSQTGIQLGLRTYVIKNLTAQVEYNTIAPYTYENPELASQSFTHYNQGIAHPYGNNFNELIGIINYKYKRLFTQAKINSADYYSIVSNGNSLTSYDTKLSILQAHLGYILNPKNNLALVMGVTNRTETNDIAENKTNYIYFSIKTSLRNLYYDF